MKAVETNFLKFLQGPKQFIVPIYQRPYSWTFKQCEQLWEDILKAGISEIIQGHFVGSIVYIQGGLYQSSAVSELLIIDGQQRLTTLSLLLKALVHELDGRSVEGDISSKKIANYYLINSEEERDLRRKLILTQGDKNTFFDIIDDREVVPESSQKVVDNYRFFQEKLRRSGVDLNAVYNGIKKLFIVDISLERGKDNPQLIFESLNSTGLELSQADLIRNYVLMGLPKEQETLYMDYWFPMENDFEQNDFSSYFNRFARDFLTIELGRIPNMSEVYSEFKTYVRNHSNQTILEIVKRIRHYSKLFVNLAYERDQNLDLRQVIHDINELRVDVAYPFLMEVFNDYHEKIISQEDLFSVLRLVESYVLRRAICGMPTNSLNKTFANLTKEIDRSKYLESLQAALLLKKGYTRFPTDEEFKSHFVTVPIYDLKITDYTLRKLENFHHSKEPISTDDFTIEHIMPQKKDLSEAWIKELGSDWMQVHDTYLHTIGNLTLTGYNSELGYLPFKEKRDMNGGFAQSPLFLNKDLAGMEQWTKVEIEKRASTLAELALTIWPSPMLPASVLATYEEKGSREGTSYTEEEHLEKGSNNIERLYEKIKSEINSFGDDITLVPKKLYIAFYRKSNFVDVVFYRSQLNLYLNLKKGALRDPKSIARDVSKIGHWGNGDYEITLKDDRDLSYVVSLIKQSYATN